MSNSLGTYGFLPWMRQGLAGKITQSEDLNAAPGSAGTPERADMTVEVTFNGAPITKTVKLVGPGDILGISSDVYVRTEPMESVYDYEANCLPFVEFYEEDFPWRYTPANSTTKQLRPWLALVVLTDDEFSYTAPTEDGLPGKITITVPLLNVLHPHKEHWAWAHVHVHQPADSTVEATLISSLKNDLPANPDMAVSRLLSSRRLKPQTQYTAFIIPAFETGRLAGLGATPAQLAATGSLLSSWHPDNHTGASPIMPNQFPVYKQWRFGTAALGDFETLARALQPRIMDPSLGSRPMDVNHSGMGLTGTAPTPTIGMEGALAPATFTPPTAKTAASSDTYTQKLKDLLNLSADMQVVTFPAGSTTNPFMPATTIQNDPVVLPPMYGQWHANVSRVQTSGPLWLQELNLDPRYRAAAGLGAKTVRDRQEQFMEAAWKQIGEVMTVNDRIAKARLALETSKSIYQKHLIGKMDLSVAGGPEDALNGLIKTAGLSFKNISVTNPAYNALDPLNNNPVGSAMKAAAVSNLTKAGPDSGFRKVTRSRSTVVEKMNGTTADINMRLTANLNSSTVEAATSPVPPYSAIKISSFSMPTGLTTTTYTPGSLPASGSSLSIGATSWTNINYSQLDAFKKTLRYLDKKDGVINPVTIPSITATTFIAQVRTALNPEVTITDRVKNTINLQFNGGPLALLNLKPVMAYPIIDEPMYDDLIKLSTEYLLPNLGQYPNNTVTLLTTNNRFIEAYMAGLNHEFAKELLWREYPTDQRGSYFRRFWDITDTLDNATIPDYLYDINPMHQWLSTAHLGQNHTSRHAGSSSRLVLLVRGDLLKKYPNALVYMQKAADYSGTAPHPRQLADGLDSSGNPIATVPALDGSGNPIPGSTGSAVDSSGNPINDLVRFPIFKANLSPDVVLLGFDLTKEDALGQTPAHTPSLTNGGWYTVFRERPGQLRFGLDEPTGSLSMASWDDITWAHIDSGGVSANVKTVTMSGVNSVLSGFNASGTIKTADNIPVQWNKNAALLAWILFQSPVMVAIHAEDMIG